MGNIAVTGSVAFDTIMVFPGHFGEHILPDQTHMLSVSFLVDRLERRRGGTAANVAYTLALLGERPLLCAAVGNDFAADADALRSVGVDVAAAHTFADVTTASAFITTDLDDNQITAFYPGAMARAAEIDLTTYPDVEYVVVTPDDPAAMAAHIDQAVRIGAKLVFAPAQQLPAMHDSTLLAGLDAAWMVVGNDYELELIHARTGRDTATLCGQAIVAVTRGGEGSELHTTEGVLSISAAKPEAVVDPTGAGDAYIAGLLAGLRDGRSLGQAGGMAALAATYVVEQRGTQEHHFTLAEFHQRYAENFGQLATTSL